jgi:hypothetical protein
MSDLPIITTSERSLYRKCPQAWFWKYRMGLTERGSIPDALWFGIGIHEALAEWYLKGTERGPHPADTFEAWCGDEERSIVAAYPDHERGEEEQAKFEDARELGISMLTGYVEEYGEDEAWDVIYIETPFKVRIFQGDNPVAYFWSTLDGVYRDLLDGQVYLMEHKTAAQISLAYLSLDDQAGSYWAVATNILRARGVLGPKEEIAGICYNFLRKSSKDERPQNEVGAYLNKDGSVSKRQPPARFVREIVERTPGERRTQLTRLANEVQIMQAIRRGDIPLVKNTSKDCTFCQFFDMCELHEKGNDNWKGIADSLFVRDDPYARYRKSAG